MLGPVWRDATEIGQLQAERLWTTLNKGSFLSDKPVSFLSIISGDGNTSGIWLFGEEEV